MTDSGCCRPNTWAAHFFVEVFLSRNSEHIITQKMSAKPKVNAMDVLMAGARSQATLPKGKKKNPQMKIKQYFKPKTNSSGFPMKYCKYRHEEGDYMYQPPWYGQNYEKSSVAELHPPKYCRHCKLEPCIVVEYHTQMSSMGHYLAHNEGKSQYQIRVKMAEMFEDRRCRLFGEKIVTPHRPSKDCVREFLCLWHPEAEESEDEAKLE